MEHCQLYLKHSGNEHSLKTNCPIFSDYFSESSEILLATAPCWLWYLASFLLL